MISSTKTRVSKKQKITLSENIKTGRDIETDVRASSGLSKFIKYLNYEDYEFKTIPLNNPEFIPHIDKRLIGNFSSFMLEVEEHHVSLQSHDNYQSDLKMYFTRVFQDCDFNFYSKYSLWYSDLLSDMEKKYRRHYKAIGKSIRNKASWYKPSEMELILDNLLLSGKYEESLAIILDYQVYGRASEIFESLTLDLEWNDHFKCINIDWTRFKHLDHGNYTVVIHNNSYKRCFYFLLGVSLLILENNSHYTINAKPASPSSYITSTLKVVCKDINDNGGHLKVQTSHVIRHTSATVCNNAGVPSAANFKRGGWSKESCNKGYGYVENTVGADIMCGLALSEWSIWVRGKGGKAPLLPTELKDIDKILFALFGSKYLKYEYNVMNAIAARMFMNYSEWSNEYDHLKKIFDLKLSKVNLIADDIIKISKSVQYDFVTMNILNFDSELASRISIGVGSFKEYLDESQAIQLRVLLHQKRNIEITMLLNSRISRLEKMLDEQSSVLKRIEYQNNMIIRLLTKQNVETVGNGISKVDETVDMVAPSYVGNGIFSKVGESFDDDVDIISSTYTDDDEEEVSVLKELPINKE